MPMRQPPCDFSPSPGVTRPGQFGPMSRVLPPCMAAFTFTMSLTGTPSVIATTRSSPASTPSRMASAANGGGTKMTLTVAPVWRTASVTVSKIGALSSKRWPPLPGVTPATTWVPYARESRVCVAPKLPVMPCTSTRVWGVTRIAMSGIELVDDDLVAIGVENDRHAADMRWEWLHGKFDARGVQRGDGPVEVRHFERDGGAVIARLPAGHAIEDGKVTAADFVFREAHAVVFPAGLVFQAKHAFIKRARAGQVRHRVGGEGDGFNSDH